MQGPGHSPLYDAVYTHAAIAPLGYQASAMLVLWHTWSELNNLRTHRIVRYYYVCHAGASEAQRVIEVP
jgi:hypothetical protein